MKKLLLLPFVMASTIAFSQVGINTVTPDPSSVLDIKSTNKGLLIPRIALTGKTDLTTIPNPANSLLVYNTSNAGTSPNNVTADTIYKFSTASGQWQKLLDENTAIPGVSTVSNIIGFKSTGNDTTYLGADSGFTMRMIKYDDIRQTSSYASYSITNSELLILKTGFFTFNINLVIKGAMTGTPRVGVSKPYTDSFVNSGNTSFSFLTQPYVTVDNLTPVTIFSSGTLYLTAGQKITFLTRYIDPTANTINLESINYNRTMVNSVVINYTAP